MPTPDTITSAVAIFYTKAARAEFIDAIRRTRDSYNETSVTHWRAWDAILKAAESAACEADQTSA